MLKIKAQRNPSTVKPETKFETNKIITALITKVKRPKVKRLIGKVKIKRIGFNTAFIIPRTNAAINAEVKLAT